MKKRLMVLGILPLALMTLAVVILCMTVIRTDIEEDTERTLKGTVYTYLAAMEQFDGKYEQQKG